MNQRRGGARSGSTVRTVRLGSVGLKLIQICSEILLVEEELSWTEPPVLLAPAVLFHEGPTESVQTLWRARPGGSEPQRVATVSWKSWFRPQNEPKGPENSLRCRATEPGRASWVGAAGEKLESPPPELSGSGSGLRGRAFRRRFGWRFGSRGSVPPSGSGPGAQLRSEARADSPAEQFKGAADAARPARDHRRATSGGAFQNKS